MPIRERIALFAALVVAATVLIFSLFIYGLSSQSLRRTRDGLLAARTAVAKDSLENSTVASLLRGGPPSTTIDLATSEDAFTAVLGADGRTIYDEATYKGGPLPLALTTIKNAAASGPATTTLPDGQKLRLSVRTWQRAGLSGYVVAGQTDRAITRQLRALRNVLLLVGFCCLAGAVLAMWLVARAALEPLTTMARTADAIADTSDLSRRLPLRTVHDEVGRLTSSFNAMFARLQDAYARLASALEAQKRFVGDASHELRTPLTTIRNNAGLLLSRDDISAEDQRAALQDIADEGDRMTRLVQQLLQLARADAGYHLPREPIALRPLVEDVVRQAGRNHPERRVSAAVQQDVDVTGNADALRQLLWILIDNAARHTRTNGAIVVSLAAAEGRALLSVSDDGEGIPEAALARIFDRFYQANAARSAGGAGLGLAIARWIADEHQGRLSARNNPAAGATFTLDLPLLAASPNPLPLP